MEREESIKRQSIQSQIVRATSPETQKQLAYVAELDSVTGAHMKLVGIQKTGASSEQIENFKKIVDAASKRFLEKTVVV